MFDDDHKIATVLRWSPAEIRKSLMSGDPSNRDSYSRTRSAILTMLRGRTVFDSRGTPQTGVTQSDDMQVDMVKGKCKKGKKKGKDKGSSKGTSKSKFGQDKNTGKKGAAGASERFEGHCSGAINGATSGCTAGQTRL